MGLVDDVIGGSFREFRELVDAGFRRSDVVNCIVRRGGGRKSKVVSAADLWLEFVVDGRCGLCGNSGRIVVGGLCGFCICPNGRELKSREGL